MQCMFQQLEIDIITHLQAAHALEADAGQMNFLQACISTEVPRIFRQSQHFAWAAGQQVAKMQFLWKF